MSTPLTRSGGRLSVPPKITRLDPPLTALERATLHRVADTLIPSTDADPAPTSLDEFDDWLDRAVAARAEQAGQLRSTLANLADVDAANLWDALKTLDRSSPEDFQVLSAIVAGAYLMHPTIKELIGYPGQHANPPGFSEAADQLADGILDPVIDRGSIYISALGE
jgi:hypothetical protein